MLIIFSRESGHAAVGSNVDFDSRLRLSTVINEANLELVVCCARPLICVLLTIFCSDLYG